LAVPFGTGRGAAGDLFLERVDDVICVRVLERQEATYENTHHQIRSKETIDVEG
jgi:hypothetical protein